MSDIQYVYPLIYNKVTSPHYVTPTLRRARLIDWLNANASCRALVVAADAGYGKTTLLWQWEREVDFPCYWYKLDRNDRDWTLHISYLIEAISQRHQGFGRRAHSMLQQLGGPGSSRPGVAAYLLAEMHERITEPSTFIIDDWQFVASVTEVRGLWNQILRDAPPTCRFVFLSRAKPQLQFARFKTHSGYGELRTNALRFSDTEIDELFRDVYHDPLDPTELAELERRTEGWAASLQLVEVSLRERKTPAERRAFLQSITATTDSDLFSFLAEEVLDQQTEAVRNFLLSTSILQQIDAELAERLAGVHEGARILADLEQRGLFTYRLDPTEARYRYHGLFRDFLERRLIAERSDGEVTGLHIHAASYYETHEQWPQAIHHYLRAGLTPQAARLIARYGEDVVSEGRLGLVDEWLHELPAKTIRDNARLSLLYGEACGIRGEWESALAALNRARSFFSRKGDRRMEALACLKLSTVHSNLGHVDVASAAADEGLVLAPADAFATRLRLTGNLAITSTWMNGGLEAVAAICRRIAVEARSRGLEHFAAIAFHNLGMVQRQIGDISQSIDSLEEAARFWADPPTSPFADNAELVQSLLLADQVRRAELVADAAIVSTQPWPRPNAEARYGKASVLAHQGRFPEAINVLKYMLHDPAPLGATAELSSALLVECLFLSNSSAAEMSDVAEHLDSESRDPRQAAAVAPSGALIRHSLGTCDGECMKARAEILEWDLRGATLVATIALAKIGVLLIEHKTGAGRDLIIESLQRVVAAGMGRHLRWWLRRHAAHIEWLAGAPGGFEAAMAVGEADPEGWRQAVAASVGSLSIEQRSLALDFLRKHAARDTTVALGNVSGADVAELRRVLINRQAPRLFIRSFGSLAVHRGAWDGPLQPIGKRRLREFLGLLVANFRGTLTRDMAIDTMWPEADPTASINSLNQTVFQLRRALDAHFRDGSSPQYITSGADSVQLNPELVVTDLDEFRRCSKELQSQGLVPSQGSVDKALDLIRGEFLSELRYEDWVCRVQTRVHSEVRQAILPIAVTGNSGADVGVRAAAALLEIDPFDEAALVAMADRLGVTGKRAKAREVIVRFARQLQEELDEAPSEAVQAALTRWGSQ